MYESAGRVLVIGGGPAGASCALRLRLRGVEVDVAEKEIFPRAKVCGCCIGGAGLAALDAIGLGERVKGLGSPLTRWIGSIGSRQATVSLPSGVAVSRQTLDPEILAAAVAAGAELLQPCRAVIVDSDATGVSVRLENAKRERRYECVVVAAGLSAAGLSRFLPWIDAPSGPFGIAYTCEVSDECEPGTIYMACDDDGYVGAVRLEDGSLDVAAAIRSGGTACKAGTPLERVERILANSALPTWNSRNRSQVLTTPPLRRRRVAGRSRLLAIGDSAGYVEPFTGEGMTWAIQSGIVAADLIANRQQQWLTIGEQWGTTYKSLFRTRKLVCRVITSALRSSTARRAAGIMLDRWPVLATPLVRGLNSRVFQFDGLDAFDQEQHIPGDFRHDVRDPGSGDERSPISRRLPR